MLKLKFKKNLDLEDNFHQKLSFNVLEEIKLRSFALFF